MDFVQYIGPSGVHALPVAAGINIVAIVLRIIDDLPFIQET